MFIFEELKEKLELLEQKFGGLGEFKEILMDHVVDKLDSVETQLDGLDVDVAERLKKVEKSIRDDLNEKFNVFDKLAEKLETVEEFISKTVSEQINEAFNKMFDPKDKVKDVKIVTSEQVKAYMDKIQAEMADIFMDRIKMVKLIETFIGDAKYIGESWYVAYKSMKANQKL